MAGPEESAVLSLLVVLKLNKTLENLSLVSIDYRCALYMGRS